MSLFLQLPQELRDRIYREHYKHADIIVRWVPHLRTAKCNGLVFDRFPSLNIELVSRKVQRDAKRIREVCWPRVMTITRSTVDYLDSTRLDMVFDCLVRGRERYFWLRDRIEEVIALDVLYKYGSGENCFTWDTLLAAMPRLHRFSFSTWKNVPVLNKDDAKRLLISVDKGEHDEHILNTVHRFGIGDLPEQLRQGGEPDWSVRLKTASLFKNADGSIWYRRVSVLVANCFPSRSLTYYSAIVTDIFPTGY